VRGWLDEGGLEVYALMFHALGVDTLEDLLDAALVGDDELVLAGMDEDDAAKFHTLRFRTAKKRREDAKKKATITTASSSSAPSSPASSPPRADGHAVAVKATGQQPARGSFADDHFAKRSSPKSPKSTAAFFPPQPAVEEDDDDDDVDDDVDDGNAGNKPEGANDAGDADSAAPVTAADLLASTLNPASADDGNADNDGDNDSVSSSEAELAKAKVEEDEKEQEEEDPKEAQSMEAFLCQLAFLPDDAATYAAVLAHLGCHSPKDLHNVTQATLTQAGIKKFHARKICSAEIYRAFL